MKPFCNTLVSRSTTFVCPEFCWDIPNPFNGDNYLTIQSNDPDEPQYEVGLSAL